MSVAAVKRGCLPNMSTTVNEAPHAPPQPGSLNGTPARPFLKITRKTSEEHSVFSVVHRLGDAQRQVTPQHARVRDAVKAPRHRAHKAQRGRIEPTQRSQEQRVVEAVERVLVLQQQH